MVNKKNPVIEVIFMSDSTAVLLGGAVDRLFLASVLNCDQCVR